MSGRRIRVVIKDGKTSIETSGFVGTTCQEATRALEERLGGERQEDAKEEMYQETEEHVTEGQ